MFKKFVFVLLFVVLVIPQVSKAKSKFFVGFGFSEMYIDGTGTYNSYNLENGGFTRINVDVQDDNFLGWNNNYLSNINLSTGYAITQNNYLVLDLSYSFTKKSDKTYQVYLTQPYPLEPILVDNPYHTSFNILKVSLNNEYYFHKNICLIIGFNFYHIDAVNRTDFGLLTPQFSNESYLGDALGISSGFGYERPIFNSLNVIAHILYTYARYNQAPYNFSLNLGGYSAGIEIRYNFGK